jgi:hypothetical protein
VELNYYSHYETLFRDSQNKVEGESGRYFEGGGGANLDEMAGSMVVTIVLEAMDCYRTNQIHQGP